MTKLNIALIGAGQQGAALLELCHRLPSIRIQAVCDIWPYRRDFACRLLRRYGHRVTGYEDYRDLLAHERDLDAAVIATPDFVHAEQTTACLAAGLHIYCEPEMARTAAEARQMVRAARSAGKLLQIGRQRRSNPRYRHALDKLLREVNLLGRLTHGQAQWHRPVAPEQLWPRAHELDQTTLDRYGYGSMRELVNWPWFTKYSVGQLGLLSSHQIDLLRWAFGVNPNAVVAAGGVDYYRDRQTYDNVTAFLDFPTPQGLARASCQFLTTTSHGGYHEILMGTNGSITSSEAETQDELHLEPATPGPWVWNLLKKIGKLQMVSYSFYGLRPGRSAGSMRFQLVNERSRHKFLVNGRDSESVALFEYKPPVDLVTSSQTAHLENFFAAVRGEAALNCPAEDALATAVVVFKIAEAVAAGRKLAFRPEDFVVT